MHEHDVIEVARAIRPHLSRLLGVDADQVDGELQELLRESERGRRVEADVLRVFARHEATRDWAHRLLAVAPRDRAYQPVPGGVQSIFVPRYVCPRHDKCGIEFYRFSTTERVPLCSVHRLALVEDRP